MKKLPKIRIKWLGIWGIVVLLFTTAGCSQWRGNGVGAQPDTSNFTQKDMGKFMENERYSEKDAAYYYQLGCHFQQLGEDGQAINEFLRAVDIDPMHAHAFNAMGVSHDRLGQFEDARQCYMHAVKVKPDFASAYNNLGYSYLMQHKPEEAIGPLRKAVSLQRDMACFKNNLSLAYQQAGIYEEAMEDCDVAEKKIDDNRTEETMLDPAMN